MSHRFLRSIVPWVLVLLGSLIFLANAEKPGAEGLDTSMEVKESIRTHSWAVIGLWWGAVVNVVLGLGVLVFLIFTRRAKVNAESSLPDSVGVPLSTTERKVLFFLIGGAAVLGAWLMFPRLDLSLWGDEEATTRRYIVGHVYRVGENEEQVVLKAPRWEKTFFNWDSGPSNQVMFSVLARLVHGPGDISGEKPDGFYFDEWKIRLPSFVAGTGSILAASWLVWLLGAPRGAPFAGVIMALHPLIIRYGTEARGYSLLMCFALLAVCFLIRALQSTAFRWWFLFGITQFFLLWSHFGAVYLLVPLNAAALWLSWDFSNNRNPFRSAQFLRWVGATLFGAMLTIQFMAPNLLQLPGYLERGRLDGSIDFAWVQDTLGYWIAGMPWHEWEPANPNSLTLAEAGKPYRTVLILWAVFCVVGFFGGLIALLKNKKLRWIGLILVAPALLMTIHSKVGGTLLYPWYTVSFIPLGIVLLGYFMGANHHQFFLRKSNGEALFQLPEKAGSKLTADMIGMMIIIAVLFQVLTSPARNNVQHKSVEPLAESTALYREVTNPFHPDADKGAQSLSFHHYSRLYDPLGWVAKSDEEFVDLLKRADREGVPIWVNTAHIGFGKEVYPKAFELLENPKVFEPPRVFWGMQQPCTRSVFKYKPGGINQVPAG